MILEVALLTVRGGQAEAFEDAFRNAQKLISAPPGYIPRELQRCIEEQNKHLLLVKWRKLEDHTIDFASPANIRSGIVYCIISTIPFRL
ncbi:MAG TPA: antibiotic biosynthesis monooxygenase family protein [Bryobacteraceae bacterium]|nr:antibiotic biosynthesis monooxygenase family protein [Bryobacteraceae bacterium]